MKRSGGFIRSWLAERFFRCGGPLLFFLSEVPSICKTRRSLRSSHVASSFLAVIMPQTYAQTCIHMVRAQMYDSHVCLQNKTPQKCARFSIILASSTATVSRRQGWNANILKSDLRLQSGRLIPAFMHLLLVFFTADRHCPRCLLSPVMSN